jgi:pilus assembly protein CpaB
MAMVLLQGVEVLAVKGQLHDAPASGKESDNKRNATAVLSVPATQLARLMLASSAGTLRLAATGSDKAEQADTSSPGRQIVKLAQLLPQAPRPAAQAPSGQKVEVFEGAQARSTYVH